MFLRPVPIGSVATLRDDSGPSRVVRYNLFPAAELQGPDPEALDDYIGSFTTLAQQPLLVH